MPTWPRAPQHDGESDPATMNTNSSLAIDSGRQLAGVALPWLDAMRDEALQRFRRVGFPSRKVEAWKFTSLAPLAQMVFRDEPEAGMARIARATVEAYRLTPD